MAVLIVYRSCLLTNKLSYLQKNKSGHAISTYQMNIICGNPFGHHGTQTLLPLLRMQVDANDTRLYAW